jgi:hypothetical protein
MRFPVFARGSNPAIDRPNQRKSGAYCLREVETARADWVNPDDHSKGILCRAFLYSGEYLKPAAPEQIRRLSRRNALPPLEVEGSEFDDPVKNSVERQNRHCLIIRAEAFARYANALPA